MHIDTDLGGLGGVPPIDRRELAAIFAGGVLGALARAGLVEAFPATPGTWPWVTFAVNVFGAFLVGLLVWRLPLSSYERPFAVTGFCGALTTFATMQLELLHMLDAGRIGLALAYAGASVAAGLAGFFFATTIARPAAPA